MQMTETILSVPEVHCGHCVSSIEGAVKALDGVEDVSVDLNSKDVRVQFDESRLEQRDIATVIEAVGYEVASA